MDFALMTMGLVALVIGFAAGGLVVRELYRGEGDRLRSDVLRHRLLLRGIAADMRREAAGRPLLLWAAEAAENELARGGPYWRHRRRGTTYEALTYSARLNVSDPRWLVDQADVTVYVDVESGQPCVRATAEFSDGRFEKIDQG